MSYSSSCPKGRMMATTTVDSLYLVTTDDDDLAQARATGRKSWKTLTHSTEVVWTPELEYFLIEAIEQYSLSDNNKPQASSTGYRFPLRNKFISDYIFDKTSKRRSAKQVGSRIQQLRNTGDRKMRSLLGQGVRPSHKERGSTGSAEPAPSHVRDVSIYVELFTSQTPNPAAPPVLEVIANDFDTPVVVQLQQLVQPRSASPVTLATSSNSIQIICRWALDLNTVFFIYRDKRILHQEQGSLRLVGRANRANKNWTYDCDIAGTFWNTISVHKDPHKLTILQLMFPSDVRTTRANQAAARKASVVYHFAVEAVDEGPSYPINSNVAGALSGPWYQPPRIGNYGLQHAVDQSDHLCEPNCSHHLL